MSAFDGERSVEQKAAEDGNGSAAPGQQIELRTYGLHRGPDQCRKIVSDCFGEWARSSGRRPPAAVLCNRSLALRFPDRSYDWKWPSTCAG